jgi:hypothetical protein
MLRMNTCLKNNFNNNIYEFNRTCTMAKDVCFCFCLNGHRLDLYACMYVEYVFFSYG